MRGFFYAIKLVTGSPDASGLFPLLETLSEMRGFFYAIKLVTGSPDASGLFPLLKTLSEGLLKTRGDSRTGEAKATFEIKRRKPSGLQV